MDADWDDSEETWTDENDPEVIHHKAPRYQISSVYEFSSNSPDGNALAIIGGVAKWVKKLGGDHKAFTEAAMRKSPHSEFLKFVAETVPIRETSGRYEFVEVSP